MRKLKSRSITITLALLIPVLGGVVISGCQSVATTSAKLRNQEGNYVMAIELAKQGLAENPGDFEAYFQLGISYSSLDSVGLAYENFIKSSELEPKKERDSENNIRHNFVKHYKLGQSAFGRSDFETATEEFKLATEADPREANGYYNLGVTYSNLAQDDEGYRQPAIDAMDKVIELLSPSDANYIRALAVAGRQLAEMGREDEARERFTRLIEEDPTSFKAIEDIGNDFLAQQKYSAAVVFLKMTAEAQRKIDSEDFTVYYNIGAAYYNMRKEDSTAVDEAIEYYRKALKMNPDEPQTIFNISVAFVSKEDYRGAVDWLEKYISISPDDQRGWQLLARCYSEVGEKEKAREAMTRFERLRE